MGRTTSKGAAAGQNVFWAQSCCTEFPKALHLSEGLGELCSKSGDSVMKMAGIPCHRGKNAPDEFLKNKICRFQGSKFNFQALG